MRGPASHLLVLRVNRTPSYLRNPTNQSTISRLNGTPKSHKRIPGNMIFPPYLLFFYRKTIKIHGLTSRFSASKTHTHTHTQGKGHASYSITESNNGIEASTGTGVRG